MFPLLSEGLVRDRHILGEATYAALLEMALLGDERDLPWAEQDHVVGVVESHSRIRRRNNSDVGSEERPRSEETRTEDEDLAAGVWWDCDSQDGGARGGTGRVLDDAQQIRNVLPLALILQYLPTMANSVQVCVHLRLLWNPPWTHKKKIQLCAGVTLIWDISCFLRSKRRCPVDLVLSH